MTRRTTAALLSTLLATTLLAFAPLQPSQAAAASYVSNPDFTTSASGWKAGSNDRIVRYRYSNGITAGHLRSFSTMGRNQYFTVTSDPSESTIPLSGSTVDVTARIRTSATPRKVVLRIEEVNDGTVVQRSQTTVTVGSTAWFNQSHTMQTRVAGSRIQVYVAVGGMYGTQYLRLRKVQVDVSPPVDAAACESIDYSDPEQGVQTFDEDFDGTSLDPALWRVRDNTFLNHDAAYIDRDNVSVHDGYLDIIGRREPEENWRSNPNSLYGEENRVRRYSTGYVDSIKTKTYASPDAASDDRFSQQYGYFEARMWVPSEATMSQGVWPAFWLRGDHTNGEIDVMESYGAPTTRTFDPSDSYEWNSWEDTSQTASTAHFKQRPELDEPIWRGWHTYGVNWSPTCLRYTFDGETVGIARPIAEEVPYLAGPAFETPFHLRFNLQMGSHYWGWPDPSVTRDEVSFKIDWVRVHQKR